MHQTASIHFPLLERLVSIGIQGHDTRLNKTIRTVNIISLLTGGLAFLIGPYLFYLSGDTKILYPALLETFCFSAVIWLNHGKQYHAAAMLCHCVQCIAVLYFGSILDNITDAKYMGLFLVGVPFLIIQEKRSRAVCVLMSSLVVIFIQLNAQYRLIPPLEIEGSILPVFRWISVLCIVFLNAVILFFHEAFTANVVSQLQESSIKEQERIAELERRGVEIEAQRKLLEQKTIELEKASKHKSLYVEEVSHELRNPISIIFNTSLLLHNNLAKENELQKYHRDIFNASRIVLDTVNNVLELASIEAGKTSEIKYDRVVLGTWLTKMVDIYQHQASEKQIRIQASISAGCPKLVITDELAITKVLGNLLTNAIKFSPDGGKIIVSLMAFKDAWHFSVKDQGVGMTRDQADQVFTRFYTTRSKKEKGTGLGMWISKNLINSLGGDIFVRSTEGEGSEFTVELPYGSYEDLPAESRGNLRVILPLNVLIVEDNQMSASLLDVQLSNAGCTVRIAKSAPDALAVLSGFTPDVILLDKSLGKNSGFELFYQIRQNPLLKSIPVIMVTGSAFREEESEILIHGINGFVRKPIIFDELKKAIVETVSRPVTATKLEI